MTLFYKVAYHILRPIMALLYPIAPAGRENIPEGPAIVCANHSSYVDPLLVIYAFGFRFYLHFMAKAELFNKPVLGWILKKTGVFPVHRGENDIGAIRTAMKCLRSGEKIAMFPEATRVSADNAAAAKTGAVRIAAKMEVPIVPVYINRDKRVFRRTRVSIGKPYYVDEGGREDHEVQTARLMEKIQELK